MVVILGLAGKSNSRPWWSYVRFSVRALIVLVFAIAAGLGWLVRSARIQREAVAAIVHGGGSVSYEWPWPPEGRPWAPRWLVDLVGDDYFRRVTEVWLDGASNDAAMVQVGRLTRIHDLTLGSSISDAGLAHLKGLTNLSRLSLRGTQLTDAGLARLKGLTNLSVLSLSGTRVSDAGLAQLKGLTNLSTLDLRGTRVTDAGLVHLKGLTNLNYVYLSGTQVTDAGVRELQKALPDLRSVR